MDTLLQYKNTCVRSSRLFFYSINTITAHVKMSTRTPVVSGKHAADRIMELQTLDGTDSKMIGCAWKRCPWITALHREKESIKEENTYADTKLDQQSGSRRLRNG